MLKTLKALVFGAALAQAPAVFADSAYSSIIAFGDSLSDNGNAYRLTNGATALVPGDGLPPMPYFEGRFSNGPTAVEQLAAQLGLPLKDYAVGGAMTGLGNNFSPALDGTGVLGQIAAVVRRERHLDQDALYVVWAGPNDFFDTGAAQNPAATVAQAVANLSLAVTRLHRHGARHFLVPGMPDLSLTPRVQGSNDPAAIEGARLVSEAFNGGLAAAMAALGQVLNGADIRGFDTMALTRDAVSNPGTYQFLDVSHACVVTTTALLIADPACVLDSFNAGPATGHLFWDDIHPTAHTHGVVAAGFAQALATP